MLSYMIIRWVYKILTNHRLPLAGSAGVAGKSEIGLETHLTGRRDRRLGFAGVVRGSWESNTLKEDLNEDLGVECKRRRVEGNSLDRRVDVVGCSDRVRGKQSNNFVRAEASVGHTGKDLANIIYRR